MILFVLLTLLLFVEYHENNKKLRPYTKIGHFMTNELQDQNIFKTKIEYPNLTGILLVKPPAFLIVVVLSKKTALNF